jgi:hypothetical protein
MNSSEGPVPTHGDKSMNHAHLREIDQQQPSAVRQAQLTMHAWKKSIDAALQQGGQLVAQVISANEEAGLHPVHTQDALAEIVAGLSETISLRGRAIRSHDDLGRVVDQLDLVELGWGDFVGSPSVQPDMKRKLAKLRAVANG